MMECDPHGQFRELCLLYGDFYRDVFLEEFQSWFITNANKEEVSRLRKSVQQRAKKLRNTVGKRGRPRVQDNEALLSKGRVTAWHRIVDGWTWPKIAKAEELAPTKPNIRTVQRRYASFAETVYRALPCRADAKEQLNRELERTTTQNWIRSRTGLPFNSHPKQCKKVVLELALPGLRVAAEKDFVAGKKK